MKINYVDWGIGNVIDGELYLNKALQAYPELEKKVIDHELKHIAGEKYVDWKEPFSLDMLNFCIRHPSTWTHWLPVWVEKKERRFLITWSKSMTLWWSFVFLVFAWLVFEAWWLYG